MRWNKLALMPLALASVVSFFMVRGASQKRPSQQATSTPAAQPSGTPLGQLPEPGPVPDGKTQRAQPGFLVLIDASHGGDDRGEVFAPRMYEKDVTLALARDLRKELEERGIPARLLRDSDASVSLDHRVEITNEQRGGIYVALHAGRAGGGVRVYAPILASAPAQTAAKDRFVAWASAQSASLDRSKALARSVFREMQRRSLTVASLRVPLRPLNNITTTAIAVELAPERGELRSLESAKRQNAVASAIASGIAQMRGQMGGRP